MRDKKYQASHRSFPCVFCKSNDDTVVGHHINIKGLGGVGVKVSDALVVAVCYKCHSDCHNVKITQETQMRALMIYWRERFIEKYGVAKAMDKMGRMLWDGLKDDA